MSRDASLDEFVGGVESEGSEDSLDGEESVDGEEREVESEESGVGGEEKSMGDREGVESVDVESGGMESEDVSAASATYVWTPAGDACARCGSEVGRLWQCEGELVCGECKEW